MLVVNGVYFVYVQHADNSECIGHALSGLGVGNADLVRSNSNTVDAKARTTIKLHETAPRDIVANEAADIGIDDYWPRRS